LARLALLGVALALLAACGGDDGADAALLWLEAAGLGER
jgi:hypothetical protein